MQTKAGVTALLFALLPVVGAAPDVGESEGPAFSFPPTDQLMLDVTPTVNAASETLNEYAWTHPHQFAGTVITPQGDTLQAMVSAPNSVEAKKAVEIAASYRGSVQFVEVELSGAELEGYRDELLAARSQAGTNILAVGLRPSAHTISIAVDATAVPDGSRDAYAVAEYTLSSAERSALSSLEKVIISVEGTGEFASNRMKDGGGKSGGAAWDGNGFQCSLGFPITVYPSSRYGATAGHCLLGSATARAPGESATTYRFGTRYTTSWPGNAHKYGDFQLLQGSTYSPDVWVSNTTTADIVWASWWSRSEGQQLCSSGRTTGQVCRYYVTDVNTIANVEGTLVGPVTRMHHKGNRTNPDCTGFTRGNSGGPVYFSHSSGSGISVSGMVTSFSSCSSGRRTFSVSELHGISKWKYVGIPLANGTTAWGP